MTAETVIERRRYDQVGPLKPINCRFDLDSDEKFLILAFVGPGNDCPEESAELALMGGPREAFGLMRANLPAAASMTKTLKVQRGDYAALAVDRVHLEREAKLGRTTVEFTGRIVRNLSAAQVSDPRSLRVVVTLARSLPPVLTGQIAFDEVIDFDRLDAGVSHVVFARLKIGCAPFQIRPEGKCRVRVEAYYNGLGPPPGPPSVRVRRLRENRDDEHWRRSFEPLIESVEIDPEQLQPSLVEVEFTITYAELRAFVARRPPSQRRFAFVVWAIVEPLGAESEPATLDRVETYVEVTGEARDRLIFSGLGEGAPSAAFLTPRGRRPVAASYRTLPIPIKKREPDRMKAPSRVLTVALDGPGQLLLSIGCAIVLEDVEVWRAERRFFQLTEPGDFAYEIPFAEALAALPLPDEGADFRCVLTLEPHREGADDDAADSFEFTLPLEVEAQPVDWLACIDFGASSTAIRMTMGGAGAASLDLRLGDWLSRRIDPLHEESASWRDERGADPDTMGYLMPSRVGLSPTRNIRAHFDPLSLGDLRLAETDAAPARLAKLERNYDISLPFPGREALAEHLDYVIVDLKRRMISRATRALLPDDVKAANPGGAPGEIHLMKVLLDCFHELGGYIAPNALEFSATPGRRPREAAVARHLEADRCNLSKRFGVIVTHPAGIDVDRRRAYNEAALRFLDGFHPASRERGRAAVHLIGEATAAARFGIQKHLEREAASYDQTGRQRDFITLDVGAGTYDVTIVRAHLTPSGPIAWKVISHFGLTCGGANLDAAIARRVREVLAAAQALPSIAAELEIETDLPTSQDEARAKRSPAGRLVAVRFFSELQAAKARLTRALLGRPEAYGWPSRAAGGAPLDIKLGELAGDIDWPVRPRRGGNPNETSSEIPDHNARLAVETVGGVKTIRLKLWSDAFEVARSDEAASLVDWIALMAQEIPRMAWCEYRSRTAAAPSLSPPVWIVTGRAALWPTLHQGIAKTLTRLGRRAGALDTASPPTPQEMKRAVVEGAALLAREPWAQADETVRNPVAMLTLGPRSSSPRGSDAGVDSIVRILEGDDPSPPDIHRTFNQGFAIARIAPGLDEPEGLASRLDLFWRLGVQAWEELEGNVQPSGVRDGGKVDWTISARRDLSGLHLTVIQKAPDARPFEFGPFKESRVFGEDFHV